jgi:hypothetical protein
MSGFSMISRKRHWHVLPPLNFCSLIASIYNLVQIRFGAQFNIAKKIRNVLNTLILIAKLKWSFFSDVELLLELYPFGNLSFLILWNVRKIPYNLLSDFNDIPIEYFCVVFEIKLCRVVLALELVSFGLGTLYIMWEVFNTLFNLRWFGQNLRLLFPNIRRLNVSFIAHNADVELTERAGVADFALSSFLRVTSPA